MELRIRKILEERGVTAETLANDTGFNQGQVSRWLSGARRTNTDFLKAVAKYFDLPISALFEPFEIPIVGYIGAGAEFYAIDDHEKGAGLDTIEAPLNCPPNAVAVKVRGDSMFPVYCEGDVIIYAERRTDIDEFLNKRCVCGLADGRILVKNITRGSEGLYTLTSFNSPPIEDVVVEWAARITWVEPNF